MEGVLNLFQLNNSLFYFIIKLYPAWDQTMRKTCLLLFGISLTTLAFSQKKSNPKIGKNETDISSFIMADNDLAFGAHVAYRFSVTENLKIGAGILYGANYEGGKVVHLDMELCLQMLCNFSVTARNGVLVVKSGRAYTTMTTTTILH